MAEGQEGAKIRIVCPSCGGSFKGRLPAKPSRGTCPRCQKDLVLLPTGAVDTETKFHQKKGGDKTPLPPILPGVTSAAPPPLLGVKSPMFHPTGDAAPVPVPPRPTEVIQDRMKDYGIAVGILAIGWILTGMLLFLKDNSQVTALGNIGTEGLSQISEKICGK